MAASGLTSQSGDGPTSGPHTTAPHTTARPATSVGLLLVDRDLVITRLTTPACIVFGRDRTDLEGAALTEHLVDMPGADDAVRAALAGRPGGFPVALRQPDGSAQPVWMELLGTDSPASAGVVVAVQRMPASQDAEAGRHPDQDAAEVTLTPQVTTDLDGVITSVNQPMRVMLGDCGNALVGTPLRDHFTEPARLQAGLQLALTQGQATDFELLMARPDGSHIVVSYRAWPLNNEQARPESLEVALYGLGERGRGTIANREEVAYDKLRMAQSEFISKISHELRSPLTSVLGYLELLNSEEPGPLTTEQRDMLGVIERGGRRLLRLVEDLLTLSQIEAGALKTEQTRVDFTTAVLAGCRAIALDARRKNLAVETHVEEGLALEGDAHQLERVVDNLLANAVKFSLVGGRIEVLAHRQPETGEVVLTITDSGIGIPAQEQQWLFTKFFRSSLARRAKIKGTGLGLYIVHEIVQNHHGAIDVRSTPGEGTTIVVRLPVDQTPTGATADDTDGGEVGDAEEARS